MSEAPRFLSETPSAADLVSARLLPSAIYKPLEAAAPWGIHVPARPRAAFYALLHGTAWLEVESARAIELAAGDVAFVSSGRAHTLRDAVTSEPLVAREPPACNLDGPAIIGGHGTPATLVAGWFELGHDASMFARADAVTVLPTSAARPWISSLLELLRSELASPGPASGLVIHRLADVLIVQSMRAAMADDAPRAHCGASHALAQPSIHRALELLRARLDEPWTVEQLAERVSMSRSAFADQFVRLLGESPLRYLARARVARAAELLRETDATLADIAARVGYSSVAAFGKAFKRWRGKSPGAYRTSR